MSGAASAIPYRIRRSSRARRVSVRVDGEDGVEVTLPTRAPQRAADAAIAELAPWIERRLRAAALLRAELARRSGFLPYLDEELELVIEHSRTRALRSGSRLLAPDEAAIERWYRRAARVEVGARLDWATASVGLSYTTLSIRGQRTRWASCGASGAMSFNWRLLLAPQRVLDYVVWHEVCHLEVADHSARFWALLDRRHPDWREPAQWLSRNGAGLVL
ncbi:MAG: M48 family metallopeptidase [Solirubrobacteraceae bacterium]